MRENNVLIVTDNPFPEDSQMNRFINLVATLALGVIVTACSQGRQDPLGSNEQGGSSVSYLTKGGDGPNLVITEDNKLSACQEIDEKVFALFLKAAISFSTGPQKTGEALRILGTYWGYAVVDGLTTSNQDSASFAYDLTLKLYDYSDSGSIYIGGNLQYASSGLFLHDKWANKILLVSDSIQFAGDYTGSIKFNKFRLPTDSEGQLISIFAPNIVLKTVARQGSVIINSGGNRFVLNPYPVIKELVLSAPALDRP
jgi:hypothetical protein